MPVVLFPLSELLKLLNTSNTTFSYKTIKQNSIKCLIGNEFILWRDSDFYWHYSRSNSDFYWQWKFIKRNGKTLFDVGVFLQQIKWMTGLLYCTNYLENVTQILFCVSKTKTAFDFAKFVYRRVWLQVKWWSVMQVNTLQIFQENKKETLCLCVGFKWQ